MLNNPYGRVALISGASSGIGACTARTLAGLGFHVYGGSRSGTGREEYAEGFVQHLTLDVTSDDSCFSAVAAVLAAEGCVDILINCAGNGIAGAVEDCSGEDALRQMDVNYAGVVRMCSAALPHMRAQGRGLIINVGSVGGIYAIPFQTLYSSSKAAVEALTEGLRIELAPWGVKAALIEPGDIKTGFTAARKYSSRADSSAYGKPFHRAIAQMEHDEQTGAPPDAVAAGILKLIRKKNPPVRCVVGAKYRLFVFLKRLFPARAVQSILTSMYPDSKV